MQSRVFSQSWAATAEPVAEMGVFFGQSFVMLLLLHHRIDEGRGEERGGGRRVSLSTVVSLQWKIFVLPPPASH